MSKNYWGNITQVSKDVFKFSIWNQLFEKHSGHYEIVVNILSNEFSISQIGGFAGLNSISEPIENLSFTSEEYKKISEIINLKLQGAYFRDTTYLNNKGRFLFPSKRKGYWDKKYLITQ